MTKSKKEPIREERIHNEVVVDAYGAEEQAIGWYYYLEGQNPIPLPGRVCRGQGGVAASQRRNG